MGVSVQYHGTLAILTALAHSAISHAFGAGPGAAPTPAGAGQIIPPNKINKISGDVGYAVACTYAIVLCWLAMLRKYLRSGHSFYSLATSTRRQAQTLCILPLPISLAMHTLPG